MYKIIPFFELYQLHAKKKFDFELWKEAMVLLYKNKGLKTNISTTGNPRGKRKKNWDHNELKKLREIHEKMQDYKSQRGEWKWIEQLQK